MKGDLSHVTRQPRTISKARRPASFPATAHQQGLMTLIMKSLALGFIVGAVLLGVAPLGLAIAFVEFIKPILAPGIGILQLLSQNILGSSFWIFGLLLNGLVYALLIFGILFIRSYAKSKKAKLAMTSLVILAFLALTGMLNDLYFLLSSPNKSWIFRIGA